MQRQPSRSPSPTPTPFSGISNYRMDSYRPIRDLKNAPAVPTIDYRQVSKTHYGEFGRYLTKYLASAAPNSSSNTRRKMTRLTIQQFHELSTDVYDELVRRKNEGEVPILPVREEFHPKRNQARQKLATMRPIRFEDLCSDVYFELARRYPEFKEDPSGSPSNTSNYDDYSRPDFPSNSAPRDPSGSKTSGRTSIDHDTNNAIQFQATQRNVPRRHQAYTTDDERAPTCMMIEDNSMRPHEQLEPSAAPRMFEQAHDFTIAGGQLYSVAGNVIIDSRHDASTHSIKVTNLWQYNHSSSNPLRLMELKLDPQNQESPIEKLPHDAVDLSDDRPPHKDKPKPGSVDAQASIVLELDQCLEIGHNLASPGTLSNLDSLQAWSTLSGADNLQGETEEPQPGFFEHFHLTPFFDPSTDNFPMDELIHDVLSRYSPSSLHLLHGVISALIFSFSPLSLMMLAALLNFESEQRVKEILYPASPFILVPDFDNTRGVGNSDQASVRFMDASIPPFFLDRTRSRQYCVDPLAGHRALLKACTRVMFKWNEEGETSESMRRGWIDAYEYASRNWERHLRFGNMCHRRMKSKL